MEDVLASIVGIHEYRIKKERKDRMEQTVVPLLQEVDKSFTGKKKLKWKLMKKKLPQASKYGLCPNPETNMKSLKDLKSSTLRVNQYRESLKHFPYDIDFVDTIISSLEEASIASCNLSTQQKSKKKEKILRKANQDLLGKLNEDQVRKVDSCFLNTNLIFLLPCRYIC